MDITGLTTDKIGHGYVPDYEQIKTNLNYTHDGKVNVAEIGVAGGAGLLFFRRLFPDAYIVGVDERVTSAATATGENVIQSRQEAPMLPTVLSELTGGKKYQLIVDDASHNYELTRATLIHCWPLVDDGGFYVIEDWSHSTGLEKLAHELVDQHLPWPQAALPVSPVYICGGLIVLGRPLS